MLYFNYLWLTQMLQLIKRSANKKHLRNMQNKALDHSCLSPLLRGSLCKHNLLEHQTFSREIRNKLKSHVVTFSSKD